MISILLSTGFEKLDNTLVKFFSRDDKITLLKEKVYFREGLSDSIIRNQPDIVLMSDKLEGNTLSLEKTVRFIRKRHPEPRIIFILSDKENIKLRKLLYQVNIFDIFPLEPKLNVKELYSSFFHPKEWKDVAHYFPDLEDDSFEIDEDFVLSSKDGIIIEEGYSPFETKFKQNSNDRSTKSVAFWAVRNQSGTTFLSINTALLLAQHTEQKVLLVDFNPNNPNIHIQFNIGDSDGNRNLGALCEDIDSQSITKVSEIDDYLITHPYYTNLRLMFGLILKNKKPSQETLKMAFRLILEYAQKNHYTSILFDLESGLSEPFIVEILKNINLIITPITETPGSVIASQKLFDRLFGPFFLNFLDLKKVIPILNKATQSENSEKIHHILQSIVNKQIDVVIPSDEEIFQSVSTASPLLKKETSPELLKPLTITANYIHNIFAIPAIDDKKKQSKKRFGFF